MIYRQDDTSIAQCTATLNELEIEDLLIETVFVCTQRVLIAEPAHPLDFGIEIGIRAVNPVSVPVLALVTFKHLVLNHDNVLARRVDIDEIDAEYFLKSYNRIWCLGWLKSGGVSD